MLMIPSTHLYRQSFEALRQYVWARDVRYLKTLAWMATGLIACGQLSQPNTDCPTALAEISGQPTDSSDRLVCASGMICLDRLVLALHLSSSKHNSSLESLVHDSSVSGLRLAIAAVTVASGLLSKCNSRL